MQFLTWDKRFETGIPEMDEQHAQLAGLLNELHDSMNREAPQNDLEDLMTRIRCLTVDHFNMEENLMVQVGYPGHEAHHGIHIELLKQIEILEKRFGHQGAKFSMEIMCFIREWLADHVKGEDRIFAEFLKRKRN